ncbi:MAG: pyrophosphatase zinc ribbon domain [Solirubrobacteraceae bacterium]|jgi:predicted amidophosphoribosyltransferase|nr:pyrophosphatase zinc ribbon domain [Solirubrobacteraceae bacterium]
MSFMTLLPVYCGCCGGPLRVRLRICPACGAHIGSGVFKLALEEPTYPDDAPMPSNGAGITVVHRRIQ